MENRTGDAHVSLLRLALWFGPRWQVLVGGRPVTLATGDSDYPWGVELAVRGESTRVEIGGR